MRLAAKTVRKERVGALRPRQGYVEAPNIGGPDLTRAPTREHYTVSPLKRVYCPRSHSTVRSTPRRRS